MGRANEEVQLCPDQLDMASLGGIDEFVGLFSNESILECHEQILTNDAEAEGEVETPPGGKPPPRKHLNRRLHVTPRDPISSRACGDVGNAIMSTATQEEPCSGGLPHGWERASDPRSGKVFYLNHLTKTTQWEPPTMSSEDSEDMQFVKHSTSARSRLGHTENSQSSIYFKKSFREGRSVQFNASDAYNSKDTVRCIQNLVRSKKKGTATTLSKNNGGCGSNSTKKRRHVAVASASKTLKRGVARRSDRESNDTPWNVNCKSLAEFKELHGHTNVPQKMGHLGKWVNNARQEYRKKELGRKSSLTKERIKQLDDIGFQWVAPKGVSRKHDKVATTTKKEVKERIVTLDGRRVRETTITVTTTTIRRETLEEKDPASVTAECQEGTDKVFEEK